MQPITRSVSNASEPVQTVQIMFTIETRVPRDRPVVNFLNCCCRGLPAAGRSVCVVGVIFLLLDFPYAVVEGGIGIDGKLVM